MQRVVSRAAAAMGLALAVFVAGAAVSAGPASAENLKDCPQGVVYIRLGVKGVTCQTGERLAERAWEKIPAMSLSSRWSGRVGKWFCDASVNEGGSSFLDCRKGSRIVQQYWHA